jgi:hypothetical protein
MQRLHDEMSPGPRQAAGVRATMILLVTFASVPSALTDTKQPINCIPLVCRRLSVREP